MAKSLDPQVSVSGKPMDESRAGEPMMNRAPAEKLGANEERDLSIMVDMAIAALEDLGAYKIIEDALGGSSDPAQVIGHVLSQVLQALAENGVEKMGVNPSIFLAKGGWLEKMLDHIEKKFNLPANFSDQIWNVVLDMVKASMQAGKKGAAQGGQPPAGPPGGQPAASAPQPGGQPMPPQQPMGGGY